MNIFNLPVHDEQSLRMSQVSVDRRTRQQSLQAGQRFGIPTALIASVLADERVRLDMTDHIQNALMRLSLMLPDWAGARLLRVIERGCGRSAESFSLGRAQMKGSTLARLGAQGYLTVPPDARERRRMLLSHDQAPLLVAACLRSTVDHWQRGGVNLITRPAVLATLYSLGLTGVRGVHPDPQASKRGRTIAAHADWLSRQSNMATSRELLPL